MPIRLTPTAPTRRNPRKRQSARWSDNTWTYVYDLSMEIVATSIVAIPRTLTTIQAELWPTSRGVCRDPRNGLIPTTRLRRGSSVDGFRSGVESRPCPIPCRRALSTVQPAAPFGPFLFSTGQTSTTAGRAGSRTLSMDHPRRQRYPEKIGHTIPRWAQQRAVPAALWWRASLASLSVLQSALLLAPRVAAPPSVRARDETLARASHGGRRHRWHAGHVDHDHVQG